MRNRGWVLASLAAAISIGVAASAHAAVLVDVDKSTQQMTVSVDGQIVYSFPVSTGRGSGYDTPSGTWKAFRMEKDHYSKEWDEAPMPNSIFFTKIGHAIHGSFDLKNMGNPASHGCVRLQPENAEKLFELVKREGVLKTTVVIRGDIMVAERRAAERRALAKANGTTTVARGRQPLPLDPQAQAYQQPYQGRYQNGYVAGNSDAYRGGYADAQQSAYGRRPVYADGYVDSYGQRGYVRRYDNNGYVQQQPDPYAAPPPRRGFFLFGN